MPCKMSHASIDAETRKSRNMPEDIIRLCVGIEDVRDLIRDLRNAVHPYYSVVNSSSYLWALLRRRLSNICIDPSRSKSKVTGKGRQSLITQSTLILVVYARVQDPEHAIFKL